MTLRFAANLKFLFSELSFEERFDAAASAGFAAVEYSSPYEYTPSILRRCLDDAGLRQVLINTRQGPMGSPTRSGLACIPGRSDDFRAVLVEGLAFATALDACFLHVTAGIVPSGVPRDQAFATYVINLAWAADQAKTTGVRLVIEPQNPRDVPGYLLRTQADAAAVVRAVGSESLGVLMDFYHLQLTEGDLIGTFDRYRDLVAHIQLADPPDRGEPGSGEIGWRALLSHLRDTGYSGWIGCEYIPTGGTVQSLDWMREWK